ncbi:tubulin-like doman-containing protein [Sphaerimonospora cavernae]|uniref:Tubulin-like doman-containing protein n=1 Tax=Sphaerimonospora cavernae TaxID=1740611 RepID=A0ABV6U7Q5_9ACTN
MRPTLIVGLGGTGSQAVVQLKQRLDTHKRWRELEGRPERSPAVVLRAFDVDQARPQAGRVGLDDGNEDVLLNAEVGPVIRRLKDPRPGERPSFVSRWFKPADARQIREAQATAFMNNGAGQIRAFGRIAFFQDMGGDGRVRRHLTSAFDELTQRHSEVDVYVVTSIAGGTGAGLLIDTLVLLQKEAARRPGLAVSTSLFCVMPAAFRGTLSDLTYKAGEANGFAALRELHRLITTEDPVKFAWAPGQDWEMREPPVRAIYLIDGTRGGNARRLQEGYPVAITDAIYAQLLPSSRSSRSRRVNEEGRLKGHEDLYSTFGVYTVEYAWQPIVSALAVRAAARFTADLLDETTVPVPEMVDRFLSGTLDGATGVPYLLRRELGGRGVRRAAPRWLDPAEEAAPFPLLPNLEESYQDIGTSMLSRTRHGNTDLDADITQQVQRYLGKATGTPAAQRQFYPVADRNTELARRQWTVALHSAVGIMLSGGQDGGQGGVTAAERFLDAVGARVRQYETELQRAPAPEPGAKQALAEQERQSMLSSGRSGRKQLRYLAARQGALEAEVERECWERATQLLGYMIGTIGAAKAELARVRDTLGEVSRGFEAESAAVAGDRSELDAAPLRRMVPTVEEQVMERFYARCVGDPPQKGGLPERLAARRRALLWTLSPDERGEVRLHVQRGEEKPQPCTPEVLTRAIGGATGRLFDRLRHMSVFEVLETAGEDPEALAREMIEGGALLSHYDRDRHFDLQSGYAAQVPPQISEYVYADVPAEGPGHEFGTRFTDRLLAQGVTLMPITEPGEQVDYPTTDKILYFAVQHRMVLPAFTGVEGLRESYRERSDGGISPHVMVEEKGAARLEFHSARLARDGVLDDALPDLTGTALNLCADVDLLRCAAIVFAHGRLEFRRNPDQAGGTWYATPQGRQEIPVGPHRDLAKTLEPLALARTTRDADRASGIKNLAAELSEAYDDDQDAARWTRDFFLKGPPTQPGVPIPPWLWTVFTVASHIS